MSSSEPIPGRCGLKLRKPRLEDGTRDESAPDRYCGHYPVNRKSLTNKRCKFHGGMNTGPIDNRGNQNGVKHGLYAKMLRATFVPDMQKLWDVMPVNTDLSNEILLARMRVVKYQTLLESGTTQVVGQVSQVTGVPKVWDVEDLLDRALAQVNRLTVSQQDMHPETSAQGNMEIKITVDVGATEPVDDDVPDLDADGTSDPDLDDHPVAEPDLMTTVAEPGPLDDIEDP